MMPLVIATSGPGDTGPDPVRRAGYTGCVEECAEDLDDSQAERGVRGPRLRTLLCMDGHRRGLEQRGGLLTRARSPSPWDPRQDSSVRLSSLPSCSPPI